MKEDAQKEGPVQLQEDPCIPTLQRKGVGVGKGWRHEENIGQPPASLTVGNEAEVVQANPGNLSVEKGLQAWLNKPRKEGLSPLHQRSDS